MFTGIIESTSKLKNIQANGSNLQFEFESSLCHELKVDQSLSHNGVCLTIEKIENNSYFVSAINETLLKTNLGELRQGALVNIERCMPANGRFDGHIVQGHVDQTGICKAVHDLNGSWQIDFEYDSKTENIIVEKGSICIDGVSLTVFNVENNTFSVALIPYTWQHTNLNAIKKGDKINLEFDIIGKYISRILQRVK